MRQQVPDYSEEDQIFYMRLFPTGRREPGVQLHFRSVGKRTFDLGTRLFTLPR